MLLNVGQLILALTLIAKSPGAFVAKVESMFAEEPRAAAKVSEGDLDKSAKFVEVGSCKAVDDAEFSMPDAWVAPVRRCHKRGERKFCDGPRLFPVATDEADETADALGLGTRQAANKLLSRAPESEWVQAVTDAKGDDTAAEDEGLVWPVDEGRMGRGFGYVRRSELKHRRHNGVDIPAKTGARVRAVKDGIVGYADNGVKGFGNLVLIVHADGSTSLYAHLKRGYVAAGQRVSAGEYIGEVGNTGLSRGPHLHFEWRPKGEPADPAPHFHHNHQHATGCADDKGSRV